MAERIKIIVEDELKEFLPKYLENRKRDLGVMVNALKTGDLKTVQVISHKIRGHAMSYGFKPLSEFCARIESAAAVQSSQSEHTIEKLLQQYRDYIERVELS